MIEDNSRKFIEWFPEQLQLSGKIQGFVIGGACSSSRSLRQGDAVPLEAIGFNFKEKNDTNHEICITHSHIIAIISIK